MFKVFGLSFLFFVGAFGAPQNYHVSTTTVGPAAAHDRTVYFVVSASGLAGDTTDVDGEADPFVKVFLGSEPRGQGNDTADLMSLGVSETVSSNSPNWNTVFKVDHYPRSKQLLYLEVRDHDPVNPDDVIGDAYIKLDDFMVTGELTQVLEKAKSGSITIKRTSPIYLDLTLRDIPPMDWWGGLSDPYVKCYFRVGQEGTDYKFNQTEVVDDATVVSFERVPFENYQRGANQILHFRVKDEDNMSKDDDLGEAFLPVDSFLNANKPVSFNLPDGLKLTVARSRGAL